MGKSHRLAALLSAEAAAVSLSLGTATAAQATGLAPGWPSARSPSAATATSTPAPWSARPPTAGTTASRGTRVNLTEATPPSPTAAASNAGQQLPDLPSRTATPVRLGSPHARDYPAGPGGPAILRP